MPSEMYKIYRDLCEAGVPVPLATVAAGYFLASAKYTHAKYRHGEEIEVTWDVPVEETEMYVWP